MDEICFDSIFSSRWRISCNIAIPPQVGDSHGGLMSLFPGLLLLLFSLVIYACGSFLSRRGNWGFIAQILVSVATVVAVAILAQV